MSQRIAPSERKAQELRAMLEGQNEDTEWRGVAQRLNTALNGAHFAGGVGTGTGGSPGASSLRAPGGESGVSEWV